MKQDLTQGSITRTLLWFALPMTVGNLLQQLYNIADTLIIGQFVGANALAAVGSSYTLMTFLTSILLGLSMGSGVAVSIAFGQKGWDRLKRGVFLSFSGIGLAAVALSSLAFLGIDEIMRLLQVPEEIYELMRRYLLVIFTGIGGTFLYNYLACLLRAIGNSVTPLIFLGISAVLNVVLDLLFVLSAGWGVAGAAFATVIAQWLSGIGLLLYTVRKAPELLPGRCHMKWNREEATGIFRLSMITSVQQSIMNFGILMVQGLVNSFGATTMAAFAAAVKIDTFAYLPVQDFGNAYSTFVAQNYGVKDYGRIQKGTKEAFAISIVFSIIISILVCTFAASLMEIFVKAQETAVIACGVQYLRIEGSFYCGIGCLFLLYGYYRAINKAQMSVVLTVISLGCVLCWPISFRCR